MKTVWWLSVFIWLNGHWVPGEKVEAGSWAPRAHEGKSVCLERKAFAEKSLEDSRRAGRRLAPSHWVCSEGAPATEIDLPPPEGAS
jgi:hypothetical protein